MCSQSCNDSGGSSRFYSSQLACCDAGNVAKRPACLFCNRCTVGMVMQGRNNSRGSTSVYCRLLALGNSSDIAQRSACPLSDVLDAYVYTERRDDSDISTRSNHRTPPGRCKGDAAKCPASFFCDRGTAGIRSHGRDYSDWRPCVNLRLLAGGG